MPEISILVGPGIPDFLKEIVPRGTVLQAGDTKVIWNSQNIDEVDAARDTFNKLVKKGYTAFRVEGKEGSKGGKLDAFDPTAERMIMVPKIAGGAI